MGDGALHTEVVARGVGGVLTGSEEADGLAQEGAGSVGGPGGGRETCGEGVCEGVCRVKETVVAGDVGSDA